MVGENPAGAMAKAIEAADKLTLEELVVLDNLQMANYLYRARNELSVGLGVGDDSSLDRGAEASAAEFFGTPHGFAWWEQNKGRLQAAMATVKAVWYGDAGW